MASRFQDLSAGLLLLVDRLFDLLAVVRKNYYRPDFAGSYSIKKTLPALVPEMSYEGLQIGNGATAVARFATAALGRCSPDELATLRRDLLDYCKQDTLAMVRLHEALLAEASKCAAS